MTIKPLQKFGSMAELVHWLVNTGRAPDHAAAKRMVPSPHPGRRRNSRPPSCNT